MAIFIVDQFSLNTDLPLDIRYVPNGGSYNDVSAYWYPGMQVYQTSDQKIWYADNSLNWHMVGSGADSSLNDLYQLVYDLSTYVGDQITTINASIGAIDLSLGNIYVRLATLDASVFTLDSSVTALFDWQLSQDASIVALRNTDISLDASIVDLRSDILQIEASIGDINTYQGIQDASIYANQLDILQIEASIGNINIYQGIQDSSISTNAQDITNIESSLGVLNNWNISQDASIGLINTDITNIETSLGLFVAKAGDTMTGPLFISGGGLVVGTIGNPLDVSIYSNLYVHNNAVIGGSLTIDGSLYVTNVETIDVSAGFIHLNTGLTGTPPASMQSGIVIGRGDLEPYVFIFDESNQTFRIGIATNTSTGYLDSSTQAVATREDVPTINGIAFWNNTQSRFDTSAGLTFDGNIFTLDASLYLSQLAGGSNLMLVVTPTGEVIAQAIYNVDASLNELYGFVSNIDSSLVSLNSLIQTNITDITNIESSLGTLNTLIQTNITDIANIETSLGILNNWNIEQDLSINALFARKDTSVLGAINIGDGSAGVYAGITADGSLQFREFVGANGVNVLQSGDLITIEIDSSFSGGEINTASNIGTGEGLSVAKIGVDLPFKSISTLDPGTVLITSDNSTLYIDVSIAPVTNASLGGLTDVTLTPPLETHQIVEYDASLGYWKNTNNIFWDISLGTTTDDLGGIPAGTDLNGLTLKQVLYKILYEYQVPTLITGTDPVSGTYEKGLVSTQFASIDVSWYTTNFNYPLALLNNVHVTKTGVGSIYDASLGLVATNASTYTDATGITNWGGVNRTITYNVTIDDDQADQSQPAVGSSKSFTFYYRQFWGEVEGTLNPGDVSSGLITTLDSSRLAGETNLTGTFTYSSGPKIKYLFAYPDTIAAPDNFGLLSQIVDQNDFDITGSWDTGNVDVSVGLNNVRYRYYLLKNKVDTPTFDVTFKF